MLHIKTIILKWTYRILNYERKSQTPRFLLVYASLTEGIILPLCAQSVLSIQIQVWLMLTRKRSTKNHVYIRRRRSVKGFFYNLYYIYRASVSQHFNIAKFSYNCSSLNPEVYLILVIKLCFWIFGIIKIIGAVAFSIQLC